MVALSHWLADHAKAERVAAALLTGMIAAACLINVMMTLQIIQCDQIGQFLDLFDNFWVSLALVAKIVFQLMEYYYTQANPIILVLACLSVWDVFVFFGSIIYLLQVGTDPKLKKRQRVMFFIWAIRLLILLVLLIYLWLALHSRTTAAGFSNLKMGALIYGLGNGIVLLLCGYQIKTLFH